MQRSRASASRVCQSKRGEERVTEKTGERLEKQKRAREKERGMGSESNAEGIKIGRGGGVDREIFKERNKETKRWKKCDSVKRILMAEITFSKG